MMLSKQAMLRPTSRPRRDRSIEWKRFLSKSTSHKDLVLVERPDPNLLKIIIEKHSSEWCEKTQDVVSKIKINMENAAWSRRIIPRQKTIDEFPVEYQGCRQIGRAYGGAFPNLLSKITNTLFRDTHRYVDAINCFPTILLQMHGHLELPALRGYVEEREALFHGFYMQHGISKANIKTAINSMIGSCPRLPADFGLGAGMDDTVRTLSEHPFILALQSELIEISNDIKMVYPHFYDGLEKHARDKNHVKGVVLCFFCQDIEDACMRTVIETIQSMDDDAGEWSNQFIWKFDGVFFPKRFCSDDDHFIQKIQAAVKEKHGIDLMFAIKDIASPTACYVDCIVESTLSPYLRWKEVFDRRFVKFLEPAAYGMLRDDGTYRLLSYGQSGIGGEFGYVNQEEDPEFLKQWGADPTKTIFSGMDFAPPPLVCKYNFLNTYRGLRAQNLEHTMSEEEQRERVKPWLTHVGIMAGHDQDAEIYLHKHLAHMIQKPGMKTGIIIYIRSVQGTGKDQFANFIKNILGPNLCHRDTNLATLKASKSARLHNKLAVFLSETNYKDFRDHGEYLKDLADRKTFDVEDKYVKAFSARCTINLFMFTNQFDGMGLTMDDRRLVCCEADGRYGAQNRELNEEYHTPFAAYINDDANAVAVYNYYAKMDISQFVPSTHHPRTKVMQKMASQTSNHAAWFMARNFPNWLEYASEFDANMKRESDTILRISNEIFYDNITGYFQEVGISNMENKSKVVQFATTLFAEANAKMLKFCPQGIEPIQDVQFRKERGGKKGRAKRFYIPAVQQWISETCSEPIGSEEEILEEARNFPVGGGMAIGFQPGQRN
jgi:hypothetical protein